eukprot:1195747-Prorocentrum_minimum.AAC.3
MPINAKKANPIIKSNSRLNRGSLYDIADGEAPGYVSMPVVNRAPWSSAKLSGEIYVVYRRICCCRCLDQLARGSGSLKQNVLVFGATSPELYKSTESLPFGVREGRRGSATSSSGAAVASVSFSRDHVLPLEPPEPVAEHSLDETKEEHHKIPHRTEVEQREATDEEDEEEVYQYRLPSFYDVEDYFGATNFRDSLLPRAVLEKRKSVVSVTRKREDAAAQLYKSLLTPAMIARCAVYLIVDVRCEQSLKTPAGTRSSQDIAPLLLFIDTCFTDFQLNEDEKVCQQLLWGIIFHLYLGLIRVKSKEVESFLLVQDVNVRWPGDPTVQCCRDAFVIPIAQLPLNMCD